MTIKIEEKYLQGYFVDGIYHRWFIELDYDVYVEEAEDNFNYFQAIINTQKKTVDFYVAHRPDYYISELCSDCFDDEQFWALMKTIKRSSQYDYTQDFREWIKGKEWN